MVQELIHDGVSGDELHIKESSQEEILNQLVLGSQWRRFPEYFFRRTFVVKYNYDRSKGQEECGRRCCRGFSIPT